MKGSVHYLSLVSIKVLWLLRESVPMLSVNLWHDVVLLLIVIDVIQKSDFTLLRISLRLIFLNVMDLPLDPSGKSISVDLLVLLKVHNLLHKLFLFLNQVLDA